MKEQLHWLVRLAYLIKIHGTGTPKECADRIGISERSLYDYLKLLREFGCPIKYSRTKNTYYFTEEGNFLIRFVND